MPQTRIKYIYWFAYYNLDAPSVRYRAQFPLAYAETHLDIQHCLVIPGYQLSRVFKFVQAYCSVLFFPKRDSIVVIQRVHSNFIYASLLKLLVRFRKSRCIYDLDDADYLEFKTKSIHDFAKNCAAITGGSEEIVQYMKQFNNRVYHLTSPILDLKLVKAQKNEVFTIGWIGGFGGGHKESLYELVFPAIKALPFSCNLLILGITKDADEIALRKYFGDHSSVQLVLPRAINWKNEQEIQEWIMKMDVGIATLQNEPLQLAKSGIKSKQYMNNGVPVLCNDLPENNRVVIDSHNGFYCNDPNEFKSRLIQLEEMSEADYELISANARGSIKQFDHDYYFEVLDNLYVSL